MTARGATKGSTRRGSLAALLAQLGDGQSVILDDVTAEGKPTRLERHVTTLMHRSPALEGVAFTTERLRYIQGDRLMPALRITRKP